MVTRPQLSAIISRADGKDAQLHQALARAQDKYNLDVAQQLNSALVRGSTVQVLTPYTQASPLVVPADWTTATLAGGVTNFSGATQYRRDANGIVWIQGLVVRATTGTIFTLPSGYWPAQLKNFATAVSTGGTEQAGRLRISNADGTVQIVGNAASTFGSVDCSFPEASYTPGVPNCFPFDVSWPNVYPPSLVLAQCMDANGNSPSNLSCYLPDWVTVARGSSTLIRVRNIPGLLASTSYAVTLVCL